MAQYYIDLGESEEKSILLYDQDKKNRKFSMIYNMCSKR